MPLTAGTSLGPYQIDAPLGAGGMGEVYKATDTRLDRTVAIGARTETDLMTPTPTTRLAGRLVRTTTRTSLHRDSSAGPSTV